MAFSCGHIWQGSSPTHVFVTFCQYEQWYYCINIRVCQRLILVVRNAPNANIQLLR